MRAVRAGSYIDARRSQETVKRFTGRPARHGLLAPFGECLEGEGGSVRQSAPVVVFAFRRPDHLRDMLVSLMRCKGFAESPVIVYCDGPRNENDMDACMATRELARSMLGDQAEYYFSDVNLGVDRSVINGVTEAVNRFGRAIVVEDDLELSPSFLTFMNQALDRYADDEKIFQVSGYLFDVPELKDTSSALFLPFTVSWGWGTWKRAWDRFDPMATGWELLRADMTLRRLFNLDGTYDYSTMLVRAMTAPPPGPWDIRWYWTVFKADGLVVFPPVSLVRNAGFDGTGTHGRGLLRKFSKTVGLPLSIIITLPSEIGLDIRYFVHVKKALWRQNGGWIGTVIDRVRRLFRG